MRFPSILSKIVLVICLILGNSQDLFASWWEMKEFPLPPQSEQEKEINRKLKSGELDIVYYQSSQDPVAIIDFYRRQLTQSGWKEENLLTDLSQVSKLKLSPNLTQVLQETLIFSKENQQLVVKFLPLRSLEDQAKTRFVLSWHKREAPTGFIPGKYQLPEITLEPDKEIVLPYPGARLIRLFEEDHTQRLIYSTQDTLAAIAEFYKKNLSGSGWRLSQETPSREIDFSAQAGRPFIKQKKMAYGKLVFSNQQGEICTIYLGGLDYTLISVEYVKQK